MPNWVKNNVIIRGSKKNINRFKKVCLDKEVNGKEVPFSFDAVIHMPKALNIPESSDTKWGIDYIKGDNIKKAEIEKRLGNDKKRLKEIISQGKKALKNLEKYGYMTWYDWCIDNWGTKWDACDVSVNEDTNHVWLYFDTAWSTPFNVMQHIAQRFHLEVSVDYADEDLGCNCGQYEFGDDGEIVNEVQGALSSKPQFDEVAE